MPRLTPDELRDVFTKCTALAGKEWPIVDLIKDHVEALEADLAASHRAYGHLVQQVGAINHADQLTLGDIEMIAERRR